MAELTHFVVTNPLAPDEVVTPELLRTAETIMRVAKQNTPVRTGRLRDGWKIDTHLPGEFTVHNDVEYAPLVEYGSIHNPQPVGMLARGVAVGLATL